MTDIYTHRVHSDIPKRVRSRISANVEAIVEKLGDNPDSVSYTHLTLPTICSV